MPFKPRCILLQIFDAVGVVPNLMLLEKAIQFGAGLEPQQNSGLIGRERTGSISFDGQSLQSLSCWIGILGQVVPTTIASQLFTPLF